MLEILLENQRILVLETAALVVALGVLIGYILKKSINKAIDIFILKRLFKKDLSVYETSSIMNKILTEIIQWSIILLSVHYALIMIKFDLFSNILSLITIELPKIIVFVFIIFVGILLSKISANWIKSKNIKNKEEISIIAEFVITAAFILTSLEYIGLIATALLELYKVLLYVLAALIIILIVKPEWILHKNKS